jgi:hypothetical protein
MVKRFFSSAILQIFLNFPAKARHAPFSATVKKTQKKAVTEKKCLPSDGF